MLSEPQFLYDAILLAMVGHLRLDIVLIERPHGLRMVKSNVMPLPERRLKQLRALALPWLRKLAAGNPSALRELRRRDVLRALAQRAEEGFSSCENGKAERLMSELLGTDNNSDPAGVTIAPIRESSEARQVWLAARDDLLNWHVARAEAFRHGESLPNGSELGARDQMEARYTWASDRLRGVAYDVDEKGSRGEIADAQMKSVAEALHDRSRALLHLTFHSGHLAGFWMRGTTGYPQCAEINLSEFDVSLGWQLTSSFLLAKTVYDRQVALRSLLALIGRTIAEPIARELTSQGIDHLIVSPCGFLEMVPLHCAPTEVGEHGRLLIDHFSQITYAPSGRVLAHLSGLGGVSLENALAASFRIDSADIPRVDSEARLIEWLFRSTVVLKGEDATPCAVLRHGRTASLLHVAAHGLHAISEFYCSGVQLHGSPLASGWLSTARVLRDADLRSTGLVILAACESGRGLVPVEAVQHYTAMDGAYLARGARAAVSTLWKIHDLASLLFMAAFYNALRGGETVSGAYTRAVEFLRQRAFNEEGKLDPVAALLSVVHPSWRDDLVSCPYDFGDAYFWGAFKCAGATWSVRSQAVDQSGSVAARG